MCISKGYNAYLTNRLKGPKDPSSSKHRYSIIYSGPSKGTPENIRPMPWRKCWKIKIDAVEQIEEG